jgi:hypothetical protein
MRSLKIYLVLFSVLILALNFTACKNATTMPDVPPSNPPDNPPDNGVKFATNVPILYQRVEPYDKSNDLPVKLNILPVPDPLPEWLNIRNAEMAKNSSKEFSYTAASLPYETKLWMYVYDPAYGGAGAPQLKARILKVMGAELNEAFIRRQPPECREWYGQDWDVVCFILKKDNTVVPLD